MYFDYNDIYEEKIMPLIVQLKSVCNMNKIPFFLAVCTKNDDENTDYRCNMFSAVSNGIDLHNDNIIKFVDILNGFDVVPNSEVLSEDYNSNKIDTDFENLPSSDPFEELISGLRNSIMNLSHAKEMITDMKNERDGIVKKPKSKRGRPRKDANKGNQPKDDEIVVKSEVCENTDNLQLKKDALNNNLNEATIEENSFMPKPVDDNSSKNEFQQIDLFSEDDVVEMQIQTSKKIEDNQNKSGKSKKENKVKPSKKNENTPEIIADNKVSKKAKKNGTSKKIK